MPFLGGYIPAYNVQSVDGFLTRLSMGEEFLIHWDPPLVPTLFHASLARASCWRCLGIVLLIWRANRRARWRPTRAGRARATCWNSC